jgi:hypothetical protein
MKTLYSFVLFIALSFTLQAQSNMAITLVNGIITLPNGGSFSLGTFPYGSSTTVAFAIRNSGNQDLLLTLTGSNYVVLTGTAASEVTLNESSLSQTITASNSSSFDVTNSATTAPGNYSLTLTIKNNDPNKNPYVGTVTYTISPPTAVISAQEAGVVLSPNPSVDGRISISGNVLIDKVIVYGLNGVSEEFSGAASFHSTQKGLLVVHVYTNKGMVAEKISIQ